MTLRRVLLQLQQQGHIERVLRSDGRLAYKIANPIPPGGGKERKASPDVRRPEQLRRSGVRGQ